jgi:chloride channel protein, CIC family
VGVVTRRNLLDQNVAGDREIHEIVSRPPKFVYDDCTARQAATHMVNHDIGRLPVVLRSQPTNLVGIVTRSDILSAYRRRIEENEAQVPEIRVRRLSRQLGVLPSRLFRTNN